MKFPLAGAASMLAGVALLPAQPAFDRPPLPNNPDAAGLILLNKERPFSAEASAEARTIITEFAQAYERLGRPRVLLRVRPEPVAADPLPVADPPASDRPAVRGVERRFARLFRAAGVTLADPAAAVVQPEAPVVASLVAAGRNREANGLEAPASEADLVVEVLVSTRRITTFGATDSRTILVPDLAARVVRSGDSVVLGQANARDVLGSDRELARRVDPIAVDDLAEAIALALMRDLAQAAK